MKILLTNDDGVCAPGLWAAAEALREVGEVFVAAPDKEQSGVGAALTLRSPVRVTSMPAEGPAEGGLRGDGNGRYPVTAYSVEGTPGDSCILGLERLVGAVDLVVSGINAGSNLGWDVMMSGTVGGALQGYVRGYTAIAISVGAIVTPRFDCAGRLLRAMAQRLDARPLSPSCFLNVNVPSTAPEQIDGLRVTRLGGRAYGESVREEASSGDKLYRISRNLPMFGQPADDTDIWAMKNNYISITPLQINGGDQEQAAEVEDLFRGIADEVLNDRE